MLIYHLQKASLEGLPFKEIAETLGYSKKTISTVVAELQKFSVCEIEQTDKRNKILFFKKKGREFRESVLPLMNSPVYKVWYIDKEHISVFFNPKVYQDFNAKVYHFSFITKKDFLFFHFTFNVW